MSLAATIRTRPGRFLFGLMAISLIALLFVPKIPQPQAYHGFVDRGGLLGIPNFWNVVSNAGFILVGAWGLVRVRVSLSASIFFLGVLLTGFSSSYYHWTPNDIGLFWDRLTMAVAFMAILAYVIEERVDARLGRLLLWPLVALGIVSLLVWLRYDDLRLYGWVQFFPAVALPAIFLLLPRTSAGTGYWFAAAGWYVLAKLLEHFDAAIHGALHVIGGHPLKHLAAAAACYAILRAIETRQPDYLSGT